MTLLVINPNTSESVTERLVDAVRSEAGPGCEVQGITARFGARYISCEASYAIAGHAALDAWAAWCAAEGEPEAVLIGCFGDPGLWALRERSQAPVIGLAEATMREAATLGRFAIVTGGAAWGPMLRRLALALGLDGALARLEVIAPNGAALAADPRAAIELLRAACVRAAAAGDVQSVVLGGAGLAGMAPEVEQGLGVSLIDSVTSAARALIAATRGPRDAMPARPAAQLWGALSPELAQALRG
jgi:Asp/Glu/hydantoin racemase